MMENSPQNEPLNSGVERLLHLAMNLKKSLGERKMRLLRHLADLKGHGSAEMSKLLVRHGWRLARIKKSHEIYKKPGRAAIITVPVHGNKDLRAGIQATIIEDAGLTEDDLDRV
jgi:predicted RNA binding protein YcfA (HicA-like mRNA interferase family)